MGSSTSGDDVSRMEMKLEARLRVVKLLVDNEGLIGAEPSSCSRRNQLSDPAKA